ncbi:MAG: uracil-DNA glycosylase [Bacteroidales bacterium]|nr:uracil-DNA glycosylase [Bacteroidales bacterium]
MDVKIELSWKEKLNEEFEKPYFKSLAEFVREAYRHTTVYPEGKNIFNAFAQTPFDEVKVVIIGQDPYHGAGQAHGLAFSVKDGVKIPPSLVNIYNEIENEYGVTAPQSGNLLRWANQGVLLLNSSLTVEEGKPASHQGKGWEEFTDKVIEILSNQKEHLVFILWGSPAQRKGRYIDRNKHLVLESPHPSPLSAYRGFFNNNHFKKTNEYLRANNIEEIKW